MKNTMKFYVMFSLGLFVFFFLLAAVMGKIESKDLKQKDHVSYFELMYETKEKDYFSSTGNIFYDKVTCRSGLRLYSKVKENSHLKLKCEEKRIYSH